MSLFTEQESEQMIQAMFGQNARRAAGWVAIQDAGQMPDGRPIYAVCGVVTGELRHEDGKGFTHEMVHGEVIIRPHAAYAGDSFKGHGIAGLLKSDAHEPEHWEKRLI
jgi:hypothetical protein